MTPSKSNDRWASYLGLSGTFLSLAFLAAARLLAAEPSGDSSLPEFARFPDYKTLRSLQLDREATDATLVYLEEMHELRELAMQESRISSGGLRHIAGLTQLERLNLSQTHVGDAGLEQLSRLMNLKRLRLAGSSVTGMGLTALKPLKNLEILDLARVACIFDDDLVHLKDLTALRELNLQDALLVGPGLTHLSGLNRLERLVLPKTRLDKAAVESLRKALPATKIEQPEDYGEQRAAYAEQYPSAGLGGGVWDPLWLGDYPRFVKIISHYVESPRHTWQTTFWLGQAYALHGERRKAVDAFHQALDEFDHRKSSAEERREQVSRDTWSLIRYVGEYDLYESANAKEAIGALSRTRNYLPNPTLRPDFSDPTTQAELVSAEACETAGDFAGALRYYLRVRYESIRSNHLLPAPYRDGCAAQIDRLRRKIGKKGLPVGAGLAVPSESVGEMKFAPDEHSLRQTCDFGGEDVFAIVAPEGKVVVSFDFSVVPTESLQGGNCAWGVSPNEEDHWLDWGGGGLKPKTFKPISANARVVFFYFPRKEKQPGIRELTVRALKCADEPLAPTPKTTPKVRGDSRLVGSCQAVPLDITGLGPTGLADAAITKLPDGRWLLAVPVPGPPTGRRSIMLSTSRDRKQWKPCHLYEHHDMFDSIEPLFFQDGEEVCMFYRSNRFQFGASQDDDHFGRLFQLWSTRLRDAVHWTRPVPVRSAEFAFCPRTNWGSWDRSSLVRSARRELLAALRHENSAGDRRRTNSRGGQPGVLGAGLAKVHKRFQARHLNGCRCPRRRLPLLRLLEHGRRLLLSAAKARPSAEPRHLVP